MFELHRSAFGEIRSGAEGFKAVRAGDDDGADRHGSGGLPGDGVCGGDRGKHRGDTPSWVGTATVGGFLKDVSTPDVKASDCDGKHGSQIHVPKMTEVCTEVSHLSNYFK